MSDEKKEEEIPTVASEINTELLSFFLEKLVPPDTLDISDIYGNSYTLPTAISARSQIKVIRVFEDLMEKIDKTKFVVPDPVTMPALLKALLIVSSDELVIESIEKCFGLAHPKVLKSALKGYGKGGSAADVFSIEELLSGVVPLFIRLLRRGTSLITKMA